MCLIVFAWRPEHALPLIVAANRDEFHARPSLALARWEEAPGILAGRDLQAGGTWMGVGANGRFAALTNIRTPDQAKAERSRGELPERFLRGTMPPQDYLQQIAGEVGQYAGFNLLVGDARSLWYLNSGDAQPRKLEPGVYGLSNAALNTPWPKLLKARAALQSCLDNPQPERLLELLTDPHPAADERLPHTGMPFALEKLLSSVFIRSNDYGTRASTVLFRSSNGRIEMRERSFGPNGVTGEVQFSQHTAVEALTAS